MFIGKSPPKDAGPIVIDGISYIPSSALLTGTPKVSFKDNRAFALVDSLGESPRLYSGSSELGFYFEDTRYLGIWEMTFNRAAPVALANELRFGGNTVVFSMTNPDYQEGEGSERIHRDIFLMRRVLTFFEDSLFEVVEVKNFDHMAHSLHVEQWVGGRFDDIFEVRGAPRAKRGRMLGTEEKSFDGTCLSILRYEGLDARIRRTFIHRLFEAEKIRVSPSLVGYTTQIEIPSKGTVLLKTIVSFNEITNCRFHGVHYGELSIAEKMSLILSSSKATPLSSIVIQSDNAILNRSIANAQTDIYMLLTQEADNILYPYAGIPWFSAPFGRDGLITAYQLLPWYPNVAKGVLDYVFRMLGTKVDPFTDEQPGKVFHELRRGEMVQTREVPFIPYYGSVDSTPLALILLNEYICWTLDKKKLMEWWPSALKALNWIEKWGSSGGDGFLEYAKQSPNGLINQGWKDSSDSIMHADGTLAKAPIRLCEVQGYAFRARMSMASLARFMGDEELAIRLRHEALQLKARFTEKFWDSAGQYVSLAIDGAQRPCAVRSSNMGHCLWSHLLTQEQALKVTHLLMSDSMFSGHGIRTLSSAELAYNPLSYHNGSVWPHDNSIIMEGLRFYGYTSDLEKLAMAMMGVLESSDDFRLPELFCGFRKRGGEPPIPYQVACKPQAWAAGSVFLMLKAMLGMSIEIDQSYLVFNSPLLTSMMNTLEIKNLAARDWEIDILIRRSTLGTGLSVHRQKGDVRVLTVK